MRSSSSTSIKIGAARKKKRVTTTTTTTTTAASTGQKTTRAKKKVASATTKKPKKPTSSNSSSSSSSTTTKPRNSSNSNKRKRKKTLDDPQKVKNLKQELKNAKRNINKDETVEKLERKLPKDTWIKIAKDLGVVTSSSNELSDKTKKEIIKQIRNKKLGRIFLILASLSYYSYSIFFHFFKKDADKLNKAYINLGFPESRRVSFDFVTPNEVEEKFKEKMKEIEKFYKKYKIIYESKDEDEIKLARSQEIEELKESKQILLENRNYNNKNYKQELLSGFYILSSLLSIIGVVGLGVINFMTFFRRDSGLEKAMNRVLDIEKKKKRKIKKRKTRK